MSSSLDSSRRQSPRPAPTPPDRPLAALPRSRSVELKCRVSPAPTASVNSPRRPSASPAPMRTSPASGDRLATRTKPSRRSSDAGGMSSTMRSVRVTWWGSRSTVSATASLSSSRSPLSPSPSPSASAHSPPSSGNASSWSATPSPSSSSSKTSSSPSPSVSHRHSSGSSGKPSPGSTTPSPSRSSKPSRRRAAWKRTASRPARESAPSFSSPSTPQGWSVPDRPRQLASGFENLSSPIAPLEP